MTMHGHEKSYIEFRLMPNPTERKTSAWEVLAKSDGCILGRISWFGRWRKYCFWPADDAVFEENCLRHIADFGEALTREQRAKNERRNAS